MSGGGMGGGGKSGRALKGLKVAVIVMGIVIVVGTGALIVAIISKVTSPAHHAVARLTVAPSVPEPAVPANVLLDEPVGTRITGVASWHGGLAVSLTGGGPDRVVLLDAALRVVARVALAR